MWNEEKQLLLNALHEKEFAGTLTRDEQQQLEKLLSELDQEEAAALRPFFERSEKERSQMLEELAHLQRKNAALAAIVEQEEQLLERARALSQELSSERQRLRAEYERMLLEESFVS